MNAFILFSSFRLCWKLDGRGSTKGKDEYWICKFCFVCICCLGRLHFFTTLLCLFFSIPHLIVLAPLSQSNQSISVHTQPFYGRSFQGAEHLYEPHEGNDKSLWWMDEGVPQCKFSFLPGTVLPTLVYVSYTMTPHISPHRKHHLRFTQCRLYRL